MEYPILTGILLTAAVVLAFLSSLGTMVMRDAFQRLHFAAVVVSLGAGLIVIAVWLEDSAPEARIKALMTGLLLFVMNSILTHAIARAIYIRRHGRWP